MLKDSRSQMLIGATCALRKRLACGTRIASVSRRARTRPGISEIASGRRVELAAELWKYAGQLRARASRRRTLQRELGGRRLRLECMQLARRACRRARMIVYLPEARNCSLGSRARSSEIAGRNSRFRGARSTYGVSSSL